MKHQLIFSLVFALFLSVFSAKAQDATPPNASVYTVSDVAVDVTADSAAKARDQAMAEGQRTAFAQLLERLGVSPSVGAKLNSDDLSTLVQNFEVQNERASSVRYIGALTVHFRPLAVRNFLASRNESFSDAPGKPVIILPIVKNGSITTLWEEPTRWMKLWNDAAKNGGIVPLIIPSGSPDDKNLLATSDAVLGKVEPVKSLIDKYQADGLIVAILNGSPDNPAAGFVIDLQHFANGFDDGSDIEHITLIGAPDKNAVDGILMQGIRQIRQKIEKDEKQELQKHETEQPAQQTWPDEAAPAKLPVTVQFTTLAEWADIQRRLLATPGVRRVDIVSVGRGATEIELGFAGKPEDIQMAAAEHNLRLTQDVLSGQWMLKGH